MSHDSLPFCHLGHDNCDSENIHLVGKAVRTADSNRLRMTNSCLSVQDSASIASVCACMYVACLSGVVIPSRRYGGYWLFEKIFILSASGVAEYSMPTIILAPVTHQASQGRDD